jgi:hypothetical protein
MTRRQNSHTAQNVSSKKGRDAAMSTAKGVNSKPG